MVARGWGIPAVVGATGVAIGAGAVAIGGRSWPPATVITIDGATGEVFEGAAAGVSEVVPEARILRGWARDLGIGLPGTPSDGRPADAAGEARVAAEASDGATDGAPATTAEKPAIADVTTPVVDDAIRVFAVKGYCDRGRARHGPPLLTG